MLPKTGTGVDVITVGEFQLRGNLFHGCIFDTGDFFIGSRDGEQTLQQRELLFASGDTLELAGDQVVFCPKNCGGSEVYVPSDGTFIT